MSEKDDRISLKNMPKEVRARAIQMDKDRVPLDHPSKAIADYTADDIERGFEYIEALMKSLFQETEASGGDSLGFLQEQFSGLRDMPTGYYFGVESKDIKTKFKSIESKSHVIVEKKDERGNLDIDIHMDGERFLFDSQIGNWDYFDKRSGLSSFWRMEEATPGSVFDIAVPDFIRRLKESLRDEDWTEYAKVEREVAPIEPGDIREVVTVKGEKRLVLVGWGSSLFEPEGMPPAVTCMLIGDVEDLRFFADEEDVYLRRSETIPHPIIVHTGLIGSIGNKHLSEDRVGKIDEYAMMAIYRKTGKTWSAGKPSDSPVRTNNLLEEGDPSVTEGNVVRIQDYSDRQYFQDVPVLNPDITEQDKIDFNTKEMQALHRMQAATLHDLYEYLDEVEK